MEFYKYQGTGNDFIMVDNRSLTFPKNKTLIEHWCHRRFGVGADGLILLENDKEKDFKMVYYNADGNESTMCGNGGRCIVAFAHFLGLFDKNTIFNAVDGEHQAEVKENTVRLQMVDVSAINREGNDFVLNTGSPHYVKYVSEIKKYPVFAKGREIRNSSTYQKEGINVNFVEILPDNQLFVRTYERGVEDETYSCGTGVTAAALTYLYEHPQESVHIKTLGGELIVQAELHQNQFTNIWLEGPALQVYKGELSI